LIKQLVSFKTTVIERINILVLGEPGAGKSSMINTVLSALKGAVSFYLRVGGMGDNETQEVTKVLLGQAGQTWVWDFPGIIDTRTYHHKVMGATMEGHVKNGFNLGFLSQEKEAIIESKDLLENPTMADQPHALIYAASATQSCIEHYTNFRGVWELARKYGEFIGVEKK